jgi:predicted amidophosphoribosyltransferase
MGLLFEFPAFFLVFVAAVLLFLLIATASQHRGYSARTQTRLCSGCGQSHPPFAEFCRRCGRKLDPARKPN